VILTFTAPLWLWQGKGAWYFITLPQDEAMLVRMAAQGPRRGWGSLSVRATIGESVWNTSLFPDSKSRSYLLPVKAAVRKAEHLETGGETKVTLALDL
jgi:hypothetical protein